MLSSIKAVILSGREYTLLILSLLLRICLEGKCLMKDKRFSALYGLEAGKNLKGVNNTHQVSHPIRSSEPPNTQVRATCFFV